MAGQRQFKPNDLFIDPGFFTNETARGARSFKLMITGAYTRYGRWKDGNWVRFYQGLPEKIGGYVVVPLTGSNGGIYIGVARALHDWASLDSQMWLSIGTHCKLYVVNNGHLYDITPVRKSSNLLNPFTTTVGQSLVMVSDPDHRAEPADHIAIMSAMPVGGITLQGDYEIVHVNGIDSYMIDTGTLANANASGGGSPTIQYDIGCGLPENGELDGFGTGTFGAGTYGTPRPAGSGIQAKMRTWSLTNWGEDLLGSPNGGGLYWWKRSNGPNARAALVSQAPSSIQHMLVDADNEFVIALGCTTVDGVPDKMQVRWCSQDDFSVWTPDVLNSAGGQRLKYGSRIITGLVSRAGILVWSDTQLYQMQFLGAPLYYGFTPLGKCEIMGPNAAADVNGTAYFMGFGDFFTYNGTLQVISCDVNTYVFGDLDVSQAEKVFASSYQDKNEVRWEYPSASGSGENDRYVIYNYQMQIWYYGKIERTAYHDISRNEDGSVNSLTGALFTPYAVNQGLLYHHEVGTDAVNGNLITLIPWFIESYDISVGGSNDFVLINQLIPDFARLTGEFLITLKKKKFPSDPYEIRGPYSCGPGTRFIGVRARASQLALRLDNGQELGQDFRFGTWQTTSSAYGGR